MARMVVLLLLFSVCRTSFHRQHSECLGRHCSGTVVVILRVVLQS